MRLVHEHNEETMEKSEARNQKADVRNPESTVK